MPIDYKAQHARRQQRKHRIAFEIDRKIWENMDDNRRKELKLEIQVLIDEFIDRAEQDENNRSNR